MLLDDLPLRFKARIKLSMGLRTLSRLAVYRTWRRGMGSGTHNAVTIHSVKGKAHIPLVVSDLSSEAVKERH